MRYLQVYLLTMFQSTGFMKKVHLCTLNLNLYVSVLLGMH